MDRMLWIGRLGSARNKSSRMFLREPTYGMNGRRDVRKV